MSRKYIGAIALETTGVRCIIFDHSGASISSAYGELSLFYPRPGWLGQDPQAMFATTLTVIRAALAQGKIAPSDLAAGPQSGFWRGRDEIPTLPHPERRFTPAMDQDARERLLAGWERAVVRATE